MPVRVSVSNRARGPVQPMPEGGYTVPGIPDPNDPMRLSSRPAMVGPNTGDPAGVALQTRGLANRMASDYARSTDPRALGAPAVINTTLPDPRWEGLKQALFESGVGHLRTGAAAGIDETPGFFDTQQPRMSRAMNTMSPRERLLLQEMVKQGVRR